MSNHTPGPWLIWQERAALEEGMTPDEINEELFEEESFEVMSGAPIGDVTRGRIKGCKSIVTVEADCYDDNEDESRSTALANARLIAAAPDLLEALIKLEAMAERYRPSGYPIPDAQKNARAAIAKVTGDGA